MLFNYLIISIYFFMLTQSQNAIIAQIQSEFEKFNSQSQSGNYLNLLNSRLSDLNNWKNEMAILTKNNLDIAYEKFDDNIFDLREICYHHNFKLKYSKDSSCDKWYVSIELSNYLIKGEKYSPTICFYISTCFTFENNTYIIKDSNLNYKFNDLVYGSFDAFMNVFIEYLVKRMNSCIKVN